MATYGLKGFDEKKWHHATICKRDAATICYIDGQEQLTVPAVGRALDRFSLGGGVPVRFRNVVLTKTKQNGQTIFPNIIFDYDKAAVPIKELHLVRELADSLKKYNAIKVRIDGYADDKGTDDYNMPLSEQRAHTVEELLVSYGIEHTRISARGHGAIRAAAKKGAVDRKVEFTFK